MKWMKINKNKIMFRFLLTLIILTSCQLSVDEKTERELRKHFQPKVNVVNTISVNETIVFGKSLVEGIDRSVYKEDFNIDIDTNYFSFVKSKEISNPELAGGKSNTLYIYKTKKTGQTSIQTSTISSRLKKPVDSIPFYDTTSVIISKYPFNIK